jgi:hypothetical protein
MLQTNKTGERMTTIALIDPNKNQETETLILYRTYREALKEVEALNKRLSKYKKNRGFFWTVTIIGR